MPPLNNILYIKLLKELIKLEKGKLKEVLLPNISLEEATTIQSYLKKYNTRISNPIGFSEYNLTILKKEKIIKQSELEKGVK
jgi:hypothetical protein